MAAIEIALAGPGTARQGGAMPGEPWQGLVRHDKEPLDADWLEDADDQAVAARIYTERPDLAVDYIADRVAHLRRTQALAIEARVFRSARKDASPSSLRALFGHPLKIGEGLGGVLYETATREQWEARRAMLVKLRAGIDESIRVCDEVLALLDEHGAERIADLPSGVIDG